MYSFERAHSNKKHELRKTDLKETFILSYDKSFSEINKPNLVESSRSMLGNDLSNHNIVNSADNTSESCKSQILGTLDCANNLDSFTFSDSDRFDANGELANAISKKLQSKHIKLISLKAHPIASRKKSRKKDSIKNKLNFKSVKANGFQMLKRNLLNLGADNIDKSKSEKQKVKQNLVGEVKVNGFGRIVKRYRHSVAKNISYDCHSTVENVMLNDFENVTIKEGEVNLNVFDDAIYLKRPDTQNKEIETQFDGNNTKASSELNDLSFDFDNTMTDCHNKQNENSQKSYSSEVPNIIPLQLVSVYYSKSTCLFILKHPTELFFHGKVKVTALSGSFEVYGYNFKNGSYKIYAPNSKHALSIRSIDTENNSDDISTKISECGFSKTQTEDIVNSLCKGDLVIKMEALEEPKFKFVEDCFRVSDLFAKISRNVGDSLLKASNLLQCSLYEMRPQKYLDECFSWSKAIEFALDRQSTCRGIVCGGKGVGKSTFLRYFVNKMLSCGSILVVDLDPGQAEFTVAGNVSATLVTEPLLGPNFTHLKTPKKMLHLGMINIMDNPKRYINAVIELLTFCHNQYSHLPWIVNTMGMCNSMGLKLIVLIMSYLKPTLVIQINSRNAKKNFEIDFTPEAVKEKCWQIKSNNMFGNFAPTELLEYAFCKLDSSDSLRYSLAPRDERYINYLAYFGKLINDTCKSLLEITPYSVSWSEVSILLNVNVPQDGILRVINGKIVALCQNNNESMEKFSILQNDPLECHGLGLVRGVDFDNEILYIITPVHIDVLTSVNAIVYSDWTPELLCQDKDLPAGITIPYRTASQYEQRQLMFAPRRRFNPLQLIKLSNMSKTM